jgi:hypothetical protein
MDRDAKVKEKLNGFSTISVSKPVTWAMIGH